MANRRNALLLGSAGIFALAGCTTLQNMFNNATPGTVGKVVVSDLGLIKTGATSLLAVLGGINAITPDTMTKVSNDLNTIITFTNTVAVGMADLRHSQLSNRSRQLLLQLLLHFRA